MKKKKKKTRGVAFLALALLALGILLACVLYTCGQRSYEDEDEGEETSRVSVSTYLTSVSL